MRPCQEKGVALGSDAGLARSTMFSRGPFLSSRAPRVAGGRGGCPWPARSRDGRRPEPRCGRRGRDGFLLEHLAIVRDVGEDVGLENEEAAVDPAAFVARLLPEGEDLGVLEAESAEACGGLDAGHGDALAMGFVEGDGGGDVDVGNAIAVGHAEGLFAFDDTLRSS